MTKPIKLIAVGDATGAIFPEEVLVALGVTRGDDLDLVATPNGMELRRVRKGHAEKMRLAEDVMAEDRVILAALAK